MLVTGSWIELRPGGGLRRVAVRARPERSGRGVRGFTLIEILVVMFIVGLMFSLAVLSVGEGGRSENVRREAERFRALLVLAQERAVLEARDFSVSFTEDGYGFLVLEEDAWQAITDDELFRDRQLPEDVSFELSANDLPVNLADPDDEEEGPTPHVLVLSSGELTPFELRMYAGEGAISYRIEGKVQGEISIEHDDAP